MSEVVNAVVPRFEFDKVHQNHHGRAPVTHCCIAAVVCRMVPGLLVMEKEKNALKKEIQL